MAPTWSAVEPLTEQRDGKDGHPDDQGLVQEGGIARRRTGEPLEEQDERHRTADQRHGGEDRAARGGTTSLPAAGAGDPRRAAGRSRVSPAAAPRRGSFRWCRPLARRTVRRPPRSRTPPRPIHPRRRAPGGARSGRIGHGSTPVCSSRTARAAHVLRLRRRRSTTRPSDISTQSPGVTVVPRGLDHPRPRVAHSVHGVDANHRTVDRLHTSGLGETHRSVTFLPTCDVSALSRLIARRDVDGKGRMSLRRDAETTPK